MKKIFLAVILLCSFAGQSQGLINKVTGKKSKVELYEEESFNTELYQKYVGKVVFANSEIDRNDPDSKYLTTYTLGDVLYIRGFYPHSVSNSIMLELEEKGTKVREINDMKKNGGFSGMTKLITSLYFDGEYIADVAFEGLSNSDHAGERSLTMGLPLNDGTDKVYTGESLYRILLEQQEKLTPGKHKIRIEQWPYKTFSTGSNMQYKPMAVGEIDVIVPTNIKVSESDCFPAKKLDDPKLEAEVMKAVKSHFKDKAPNAYKIILTQRDMTIIRNEYGSIIRKAFFATVVYKKGNEVWYENIVLEKMWDGLEYLPLRVSISRTIGDYTPIEGRKVNAACLKYLK